MQPHPGCGHLLWQLCGFRDSCGQVHLQDISLTRHLTWSEAQGGHFSEYGSADAVPAQARQHAPLGPQISCVILIRNTV